eukprot:scaffold1_cov402-Prasinococcus_capsulatus_cf.AAC.36
MEPTLSVAQAASASWPGAGAGDPPTDPLGQASGERVSPQKGGGLGREPRPRLADSRWRKWAGVYAQREARPARPPFAGPSSPGRREREWAPDRSIGFGDGPRNPKSWHDRVASRAVGAPPPQSGDRRGSSRSTGVPTGLPPFWRPPPRPGKAPRLGAGGGSPSSSSAARRRPSAPPLGGERRRASEQDRGSAAAPARCAARCRGPRGWVSAAHPGGGPRASAAPASLRARVLSVEAQLSPRLTATSCHYAAPRGLAVDLP